MEPLPQRPDLQTTLTELPRAGLEAFRLAIGFRQLVADVPRGDGRPVLVLPSYGLGDSGMTPLRRFLRRIGYATPLSGIELNLDRGDLRIRRIEDAARFRGRQVDRVVSRIEEIHAETGEKPSLVGWSMGGLFAFDASQRIPERVRRVVTLGSPFGDPRGTAMWDFMRWLSGSEVPVDQQDFSPWLDRAALETAKVPVTVVYSEVDGIVGKEIARIRDHHAVRHRLVTSSHLGFATNPDVFREIAGALASNA
jgi:pimeloyl-ACP methyl ester carboxylesterase